MRVEQEEVPSRKGTTQDNDKTDKTEDPIKLETKHATSGKAKKGKGGQKSGSRQPQTCTVCATVLSSRGALTKHMIIHQVN